MVTTRLFGPLGWLAFALGALVLLVLLVLVPLLNLSVPATSPWHLPSYLVPLLGKYACFALLALSLDLVWGYAGILSLGHGAFFALGGYAIGMHLMREIGTRGVYGHPLLPDFMVFLDWKELPWYWWGFDSFAFALLMVVLVPGTLAFVFGWLAFRSRVTGVYFSIITQAMTFALMLAFFRNDMGFGGNNGLTDFKDLLGFDLQAPSTRLGLYLISVLVLGLAFLLCVFITRSKLGRLLLAIRDAESRVRFLGYSVSRAQPAGAHFRAVPGAQGDAAAARRRSVRRPAAAAGDRPRAGDAAAPPGARRADRGHPALDHQGYRQGDPLPARHRRHRRPAGRAISRFLP